MEQNIQIENLCNILRRETALLPQGGRLPTVREIMRRYGTHRGIVDAALKRLEEEQLIVRWKRIGIFSRLASDSADLRVLFCYMNWPSSTIREWVECAKRYVTSRSGWKLTLREIHAQDSFDRLDLSGHDALIMVLNNRIVQDKHNLDWLSRLQLPAIVLDAELGFLPFSTVRMNDGFGMLDACRYLYSHGHRSVGYIRTEPKFSGPPQLADYFRKGTELLGMTIEVIESEVSYGEFSAEKSSECIQNYLDAHNGQLPFTALFCESHDPAVAIAGRLLRGGIRIPEELSIMTRGGASFPPGTVPLTLIAADFEQEIAEVFNGLRQLVRKEICCFRKYLPMHIVDRGSVAEVNSASGW